MGGPGSGSHWRRPGKKTVVEDCLSLDTDRWTRAGTLKAGIQLLGSWRWTYRGGGGFTVHYEVNTVDPSFAHVRLTYSWVWTSTKQEDSEDYLVDLTATVPRFGGLRWWFVCPLVVNGQPCKRRVRKLYLPPDARHFSCRHCHDLTYTSCQESRKYDSAFRILAREMGHDFHTVKRLMKGIG